MTERLQPRWIDSHCHIYDERTPGGAHAALNVAREAGVEAFIVIGCDRDSSLAAIDAARHHDDVFATVGLHPHEASHGVASITDLLDQPRVVAIGEAGLDYHYDNSSRPTAFSIRRTNSDRSRSQPAVGHSHPKRLGRHIRHP